MTDLPRRLSILLPCVLLASFAWGSKADEPLDRPIVAGFERFHAEAGSDPKIGGRLLVGELNCTSCHAGDDSLLSPVLKKKAPILDKVGSRVKVEHLRAFLANPQAVKPGTTMPDLLHGSSKEVSEANIEALVHFLASTGTVLEKAPNRKQIEPGRVLYEQVGCAACHGSRASGSPTLSSTVPMGEVTSKFSYNSLTDFLLDPLGCRPSGRMPGLGLKPTEAQAIASFLFKDVHVEAPPTLSYKYYEGEWTDLPDFAKLEPVASGITDGFDLTLAKRPNHYAIRFEGTLPIARDGGYSFHLSSDDGSKLTVDGRLVTSNDGIHPTQSKSGRMRLSKGNHKLVVDYFDGGGQTNLDVEYEGSGISRRPIAPDLALPEGVKPVEAAQGLGRFVVDPEKADRGRSVFAEVGCASCHQIKLDGQAIASKTSSKPLSDLKPDAGCLAVSVPKSVPNYHLSTRQKEALAGALKPDPRKPSDSEAISRTFLAFACTTCHQRDGVGGVEAGRDPVFATTQKEMGEEGRIPPNLSGVGGKLTQEWLKHVLSDGAKDRPYMLTRMPKFGEANVGHLVRPLETLDVVPPVATPDLGQPIKRVKANGRFMVGAQAFNCGACHKFKEFEANGIQALDMTMMTKRLRRDWFHRYVVDPQQYRPGTRMPAAWPGGKSQLDTILDGDTLKQVEAVWQYLSDGPEAAVPYGLGRDPIPLVAEKVPVIYRNFIQGAGSRAIGVGYPEKANLAFDANDLRLALIWQGAFIDASKHWVGRGVGYEGPLGDNIVILSPGASFAELSDESSEWPRKSAREMGQKFRGYRLTREGRPAFLYEVGGLQVDDYPEAVPGKEVASIRRTIAFHSDLPVSNVYFRAASSKSVKDLGGGWYLIDGEWKLRLDADSPPIIRQSAGKSELIVPVKLKDGHGRIIEEFAW